MCDRRPSCAFSLIKHCASLNTARRLLEKKRKNAFFLKKTEIRSCCLCLRANSLARYQMKKEPCRVG